MSFDFETQPLETPFPSPLPDIQDLSLNEVHLDKLQNSQDRISRDIQILDSLKMLAIPAPSFEAYDDNGIHDGSLQKLTEMIDQINNGPRTNSQDSSLHLFSQSQKEELFHLPLTQEEKETPEIIEDPVSNGLDFKDLIGTTRKLGKKSFIFTTKFFPNRRLQSYEQVRESLDLSKSKMHQFIWFRNSSKKVTKLDLTHERFEEIGQMKRMNFQFGPFQTNKQGVLKIKYWHLDETGTMALEKYLSFSKLVVQNQYLYFTSSIPRNVPITDIRMRIQYAVDGILYYKIFEKVSVIGIVKKIPEKRKRE